MGITCYDALFFSSLFFFFFFFFSLSLFYFILFYFFKLSGDSKGKRRALDRYMEVITSLVNVSAVGNFQPSITSKQKPSS